jgi:hypothetical protein
MAAFATQKVSDSSTAPETPIVLLIEIATLPSSIFGVPAAASVPSANVAMRAYSGPVVDGLVIPLIATLIAVVAPIVPLTITLFVDPVTVVKPAVTDAAEAASNPVGAVHAAAGSGELLQKLIANAPALATDVKLTSYVTAVADID